MTASAFSANLTLPGGGLEVLSGTTVLGGLRGPDAQHHHCPDCMSWIYTTAPVLGDWANLRATMLDDPNWVVPFMEIYANARLPWVTTPVKYSFPELTPAEDYPTLASEYAATLQTKER